MKGLVVAIILVQILMSLQEEKPDAAYKELFEKSLATCTKENGVGGNDVVKIWKQPDFAEKDEDMQCFYNCLNRNMGVTDEDGSINADELMKTLSYFSKATVDKDIIDDCKKMSPQDGDLCEFGYKLIRCVAEALKG